MDQDEEEEGSMKDEDTDLKNTVRGAANFRKLICVDETSKVFMLLCYITILKFKVYMTDFFFICSIKSPQCTDKYSKNFFP